MARQKWSCAKAIRRTSRKHCAKRWA